MKKYAILFTAVFIVSCAKEGKNGEDPFNPVYDLGLIAATTEDLQDASVLPSFYTGVLPVQFNLNMPPIGDQAQQGSCIAFSAGYAAMGFNINRFLNGNYSFANIGSPKFLFNLCKASDCDGGSNYPLAFKVLKDKGICTWSNMPYSDNSCSEQPNSAQYSNANNFKINSWSYVSLNNTDNIKRLLYSKYPVMIGINCYDNLQRYTGGLYNTTSGKNLGGHAVCIIGYDDNRGAFKIQNSWSTTWGEAGFFWVPYSFLYDLGVDKWGYVVVPSF